jgi:hypothetical protein
MFMRAPRKTPGKCAESVQIDTTPKMLENPGKSEAYAKLIGRLTGQQCIFSYFVVAIARGSSWHTFPVRCAAAIASGYKVTFVVPVTRLAGELLTPS